MNNITEYIAIVIGGLTIIAGFSYGIYDTYFRKDTSNDTKSKNKKQG